MAGDNLEATLLGRYLLLRNAVVDPRLGMAEVRVLAVVLEHQNSHTGKAFPGFDRMSAITGMHRTSHMRAVAALERLGYLAVERAVNKPNRYEVVDWPTSRAWPSGSTDATSRANATGSADAQLPVASMHKTGRIHAQGPVAPVRPEPTKKQPTKKQPTTEPTAEAIADAINLDDAVRVKQAEIQENESEGTTEKHRRKQRNSELPEWLPLEAWNDWCDFRRLKKGWTDRARQLSLRTLTQLHADGNDARQVIERSIERGWSGLFPLSQSYRPQPPNKPSVAERFAGKAYHGTPEHELPEFLR